MMIETEHNGCYLKFKLHDTHAVLLIYRLDEDKPSGTHIQLPFGEANRFGAAMVALTKDAGDQKRLDALDRYSGVLERVCGVPRKTHLAEVSPLKPVDDETNETESENPDG